MWKFLSIFNKYLVYSIPVSMVLGFIYGYFFDAAWLKNLIVVMTLVMIFPMMVTLKVKSIIKFNDARLQIITQVVNFIILPFIALLLSFIFFKDEPYFALGLFIASLLPTSGMTISWTGFAKGNIEAAVKMTVIGLTLGSIALPFYINIFMGQAIEYNLLEIVKQIIYIVFIPMFFGQVVRQFIMKGKTDKDFKEKYAPKFSSISTLGVLGIVFIAMALKSQSLLSKPLEVLYIFIPVIIFYFINYLISTLIGKFFMKRADAIAHVYGTVMRNLSISLAIALNSFGEKGVDAALVIAVAFIFQVQSAAWYVKLCNKFFGKVENS